MRQINTANWSALTVVGIFLFVASGCEQFSGGLPTRTELISELGLTSRTETPIDIATFRQTVAYIDSTAGPMVTYGDFLYSEEFRQILDSPVVYLPKVLALLEDDSVSAEEKTVVIMAMQKLENRLYWSFFQYLCSLYLDQKLHDYHIEAAILAPLNGEGPILVHYFEPKVRGALKTVAASPLAGSYLQLQITWVLYGLMKPEDCGC